MKKRKTKKIHQRLVFWLGVLVLGMVVGIAVQFTRAWVEPSATVNPPGGDIAAPINTGASIQIKVGTASQKADICVDPFGTGDIKCLGDLVSFPGCTSAGGVPTTIGTITICKFPGASCPSGWTQYLKYTETRANSDCNGGGDCGTSVTSGSHLFDNIDPVTETRSYNDGSRIGYPCQDQSWCYDGCQCDGYPDFRCCCSFPWTTCYTSCSATAKACNSIITAVGCVHN